MYSKKGSLIIILLLLIPFVLRLMGYEPYPAILLPEGAVSLRKVNNQIKLSIHDFQGLNHSNKWVRLDPETLIHPIPPTYMRYIYFKDRSKSIDTKLRLMNLLHLSTDSLKARYAPSQSNKYLKSKLQANGFNASQIKMVHFELTIQDGKVIDKKVLNEKVVNFD